MIVGLLVLDECPVRPGSVAALVHGDPERFAGMIEAVHRYEGTVNQMMGDGTMA
jgi:class 3 adenylate cyclase